MGGVTINTDGEVLNVARQPIRGAYAAGEVVGGIHGGNRIGVTRWRISSSSAPSRATERRNAPEDNTPLLMPGRRCRRPAYPY